MLLGLFHSYLGHFTVLGHFSGTVTILQLFGPFHKYLGHFSGTVTILQLFGPFHKYLGHFTVLGHFNGTWTISQISLVGRI